MGRRIRTSIPQSDEQLIPSWSYLPGFQELNKQFKARQKRGFDRRHRVRELPELPEDTEVWITSHDKPVQGRVASAPLLLDRIWWIPNQGEFSATVDTSR